MELTVNKELIEAILKASKETSTQDIWEQIKKVEEAIQGSLDEVENLEDVLVNMLQEEIDEHEDEEEEKYLDLDTIETVAKSKGLQLPEGGVVRKRMGLSFARYFPEEEVTSKSAVTKGAKKSKAEDYYPTPEELALINKYSNIELSKEEVLVFSLTSADQNVDRAADQFTPKALKDMAERSPDKPYLLDHNWSSKSIVGKIFDAKAGKTLQQKVYVPITEKHQEVIDGMLTGLMNKVSVGFAMDPKDYVCSSCNKSLYSLECSHYPGGKDKEGKPVTGIIKGVKDYFEISNVAVPCQPAAGIRRSTTKSLSNEEMTNEEQSEVMVEEKDTVDRISNEIIHDGDNSVEDNKEALAEVTTNEEAVVEEVETEKSVNPSEQLVKEAVAALATEVLAPLKEMIAELKSVLQTKVEAEKTADEESTEEIARKLLASSVEKTQESTPPSAIDYSKKGWSAGLLGRINGQ